MGANLTSKDVIRSYDSKFGDYIDCGCFGAVYPVDDRRVVKVSQEQNDGWRAWAYAITKHNLSNPYLPRFHSLSQTVCSDGTVVVAVMERLQPLRKSYSDYDDYLAAERLVRRVVDMLRDSVHNPQPSAALERIDPLLAEAGRLIHYIGTRTGARFDLHLGNVMLRGRQLVITDPLSTWDGARAMRFNPIMRKS